MLGAILGFGSEVLLEPGQESLPAFLVDTGVDIIASLPSYEPDQTDRRAG